MFAASIGVVTLGMGIPYQERAAGLNGRSPGELAAAARRAVDGAGVTFGAKGDERFRIDPVPRVIGAAEWARLEAGLAQRLRALDAFCADAYGERRIVHDGVMPARVIDTCETYEPELQGLRLPIWVGVAGLDVVRAPDGGFLVLEDNLRTPSGMAYAVAARLTTETLLAPGVGESPQPLGALSELLASAIEAAAPSPGPRAVVLTDGPDNSAYWEHGWLAAALGVPLVTPAELEPCGAGLRRRGGEPIDVVYRRTNADRVGSDVGQLLLGPWRAGALGLVNAFGIGVGDDKLVHAYVEDMVRFYLGEEPALRSVRTYDLCVPELLEEALDRLGELVVKPRSLYGGEGVVICPHAEPADVLKIRAAIADSPADYVVQELVELSTHATVVGDALEPRHVDLRPFAFLGPDGEARVLPGGLTRVAFDAGALVVNSSQNGGAKDTWVLPA
jgi:uncharacterized circularly permuted ATP-grasp superfamily protein